MGVRATLIADDHRNGLFIPDRFSWRHLCRNSTGCKGVDQRVPVVREQGTTRKQPQLCCFPAALRIAMSRPRPQNDSVPVRANSDRSAAANGQCPADPDEVAEAFVMERLSPADISAFEEHVRQCDSCARALEDAGRYVRAMKVAAQRLRRASTSG